MAKKTEIRTELNEVEDVVKIVCDSCGKVDTDPMFSDITTIQIEFGFGSKYDGDIHEFELCDNCYDKMIKLMNIKPRIEETI